MCVFIYFYKYLCYQLKAFFNFYLISYSYRNASIGFMLAAFTDGISPKITPISVENRTATTIAVPLIATGTAETPEIIYASAIPTATPMIPPSRVSTAASVRNWNRILLFLAPSAFLSSDLSCTLCDRYKHDIHNSDSSY